MSRRRRSVKKAKETGIGSVLTWFLSGAGLVLLGWVLWKVGQTPVIIDVSDAKTSSKRPDPLIEPEKSIKPIASINSQSLASITNVTLPTPLRSDPPKPRSEELRDRPATTLLEAQVALARQGFSSGSIDGVNGSQTKAALRAFQARENLPVTGQLDALTQKRLTLPYPALTNYLVTSSDLERLSPVPRTWLGKSQAERLDFENLLELVSEKHRAHPDLIRKLNPDISWTNVTAGTVLSVPAVQSVTPRSKAAFLRIELSRRVLEVYDSQTNLIAHFPCSIAQRMEKRPVGELQISSIATNPNYRFDPDIFPESAEARELKRRLVLPSGPNNPVGLAWIGLNKPGYGIHGTPRPEDVGRTESHGCFRLANWDAETLIQMVSVGTRVIVEP